MEFVRPEGPSRYAALVRAAPEAAVGLDFDGTLSPIVADPAHAVIHPEAPEVLVRLGARVRSLAVITGRPVEQVVALGQLNGIGDSLARSGQRLEVFGHYGAERWASDRREVSSPPPPPGLADFRRELDDVLAALGINQTHVEPKGLAVAVHTRRLPDPDTALADLEPPLRALAAKHGLAVEPGRQVLEVRASTIDKGDAVRTFVAETGAQGFLFAGDDLGDLEAYAAVTDLRAQGLPTLLVCSASSEQKALRALADVTVDGPDGILTFLRQFTDDVRSVRTRSQV